MFSMLGTSSIEVLNLVKMYRKPDGSSLLSLDGASFAVEGQQFVCILGPSGCGKSTLLNIIAGLDMPSQGKIIIGGKCHSKNMGLQRPPIAFVFQQPRLLPWLTVEQNVFFAMSCRKIPKPQQEQKVKSILSLVGLDGFEHYYVHQLSGGMQQRTSIARALSVDPEILLMDEPFSSLDEITARHLRVELLNLWDKMKKTIIFVTHNAFEATYLADRILIFTPRPGRVCEDIQVPLKRPRSYEDPDVFEFSGNIVKKFLQT